VLSSENRGTDDFQCNLLRWKDYSKREINWLKESNDFPALTPNSLVIDALFGSGLSRPLDGINALLIHYLNEYAKEIISIDLPSGIMCDTLETGVPAIQANYTLSFQSPKLAFYFPENEKFIGEIHLLDIGLSAGFLHQVFPEISLINQGVVEKIYKPRQRFSHKGTFGHALILAGSYGKTGAALLAAKACMHSGVGLLTMGLPQCAYLVLQVGLPEAMVTSDEKKNKLATIMPNYSTYQAVGIGPGIGTEKSTRQWLLHQLLVIQCPLVLDADALNAIAYEEKWQCIPENSILTPHPKEFDRLFGLCQNSQERMLKAIQKAKELSCTVVLKGHHTLIATAEGEVWFNTTGNAGMATGGSGDVLTGIITGLLAQGYVPKDAALLGVWLHGQAGDIALKRHGQEALVASHIIEFLGDAFLLLAK
jgi:NAD(P)H-hydrate epimerase